MIPQAKPQVPPPTPNEQKFAAIGNEKYTPALAKLTDLELAIKMNQDARLALAHQAQRIQGNLDLLKQHQQQDVQLEQQTKKLQADYEKAKTEVEAAQKESKNKILEEAKKNPLESTPEDIDRLNHLKKMIKLNDDARLTLAHQAQKAMGNPQLIQHYNNQDKQLEKEKVEYIAMALGLEAQLAAGRKDDTKPAERHEKGVKDQVNLRTEQITTDAKMIKDLDLALKLNETARTKLANKAQNAAGNPQLLLQYHQQDLQLEEEKQMLKMEQEALKTKLSMVKDEKDPYKATAHLAALESTPENLEKLNKLKAEVDKIRAEQAEVAKQAESVDYKNEEEKYLEIHKKDVALEVKALAKEEQIKAMEAQLAAGEKQVNEPEKPSQTDSLSQIKQQLQQLVQLLLSLLGGGIRF